MTTNLEVMMRVARRNARSPELPLRNFGGRAIPVPAPLGLRQYWCLRLVFLANVAVQGTTLARAIAAEQVREAQRQAGDAYLRS